MEGMEAGPWFAETEHMVGVVVQWLRLGVEAMGAVVVAVGVLLATWRFLHEVRLGRTAGYTDVRLILARYLIVALEFQLAADILTTAIAPTWQQIGQLAAIAVIRTGLNYFLMRELESEQIAEEVRMP